MADPFAQKNRADERASNQKAAKDAIQQRKQDTAKKMLDRMKPVFNDLPQYKFKDAFRLGL